MASLGLAVRQRFVRLLHRGLDLGAFFPSADRAVAELIDFDGSCWLSLDPSSLLPTSHFTRELGSDHLLELAANEFLEDDVNKFADLARDPRPVGILSQATAGHLDRSPRFARVLVPHGHEHGDEMRAVFIDGGSVWGCVALHRRNGRFHDNEANRMIAIGHYLAEGIRRAILTTALTADGGPDSPGLILLRGDDSVESMTPAAGRWLAELLDTTGDSAPLPLVIVSIVDQARCVAAGQTEEVASVRFPTRTGGWLSAHASLLDEEPRGRVAVVLAPVREPHITSLLVEAHGLSLREREVTQLVLHGLSTREIANQLYLSAYTIQDHLKAIFDKVGVRSRRELVAHLFLQHYAPRLEAGAKLSANGWFVGD